MSKQKTVFDSREIAHIWAHRLAHYGSTGSRGNVSFNSDGIYSYSTLIARFVENKRGERACVFNSTSYSNTTAKTQSRILQSLPDSIPVFRISGLGMGEGLRDVTGSQLFNHAIECAAGCARKAKRARCYRESYLAHQANLLESARRINSFFGLRRKVDEKAIERLANIKAREERRQARERAEKERQYAIDNKERLSNWLAGALVEFPYGISKVYLRQCTTSAGDFMETSRGVRVPMEDARRALSFILKHRNGEGWRRNGQVFHIGDYQIDSVSENGVIAGCHHVSWEEIERFAGAMGWTASAE